MSKELEALLTGLVGVDNATIEEIKNDYDGDIRQIFFDDIRIIKNKYRSLSSEASINLMSVGALVREILNGSKPYKDKKKKVVSPGDVYNIVRHKMAFLNHEELWVVMVDGEGMLKKTYMVSKGDTASCSMSANGIIREAILSRAHAIAIAHSHPGGKHDPSDADIEGTKALAHLLHVVEIGFLDHIVVSSNGFTSIGEIINGDRQ